MEHKKKVLIITETLPHYRVGLFSLLAEPYDLTIAHSGPTTGNNNFNQIGISKKQIGPFISLSNLPKLSFYDVVILTFNIRILNCYKIIFSKRKYKLLFHGIGVSASYKNLYDQSKSLDFIRRFFIKKSDGTIFYEQYPVTKYQSYGIAPNKLHVAYNTVTAPSNFNFDEKTYQSFVFIGALYKEKRIYELLDAFLQVCKQKNNACPNLEIIGDGEEYENILNWTESNNLTGKVTLHGKVIDEKELTLIFNRALATISPGQAGLSVQKSFSYGVPYITANDAITGGELFSIINGTNGFLYDGKVSNLVKILLKISDDKALIKEVSRNAFVFYQKFRNADIWLSGFKRAIEKT